MTEKRASRSRRRPNTRARVLFIILGLSVFIAVIIAFVRGREGVPQNSRTLPFASSASHAFAGKGVAYIDGTLLHYNDLDRGKSNWFHDLSLEGLQVSASESMIVVYSDSSVQVLSPQGDILSKIIEFSNEVLNVVCGKNYFAVLSQDTQKVPSLSVISINGNQLEPLQYPANTILDYRFYGEADQLWTLAANVEGASPALTISTYKTGSSMTITSVILIQDELIDAITLSGQNLYAIGSNNLYTFDASGQIQTQRQIYGWNWLDSMSTESKSLFLFKSHMDAQDPSKTMRVKLVSTADNDINFRLPASCIGAFLYSDKLLAVTTNHVYVFDLKGSLIRDYALDREYQTVEKVSYDRLLFSNGEELYLAPIR